MGYFGSTYFGVDESGAVPSGYVGRYTSVAICKTYRGSPNVVQWSSTDGTGVEDPEAEQYAIDVAEDFIDDFFDGSIYAIPFTPTGAALPIGLVHWATVIATFNLYAKRGLEDADPKRHKLQADYDSTLDDMQKVLGGTRGFRGVAYRDGATRAVQVVTPKSNRLSDGAVLVPTTQWRGPYG